jgi:hypothetical protein
MTMTMTALVVIAVVVPMPKVAQTARERQTTELTRRQCQR